ncbi:nicotinamidase [Moraxella nasovis]|uniref:nicotinamidase n=1 Tax=Moraxella nasovis TaxID=2904121 RepID=UPI001F60EABE|nr:nicotinamidase [Moraxella nasovis]UNU73060.1 nicotinamidase [Moraxella nasovis]
MVDQRTSALIAVDMQNSFIGGNLAVLGSELIIDTVNELIDAFDNVILTQDYHPADHICFYQNHANKNVFDVINLPYGKQILWNAHCVIGTDDVNFHQNLLVDKAQLIVRKGFHRQIDSYSAFLEADRRTKTGLAGYLQERDISHVYVVGIATDFCVAWTAMDARTFGFDCTVVMDATASININGSLNQAIKAMKEKGVAFSQSSDILNKIN